MKTKKIFSALLAVCMLVSIMAIIPASAYDAANPLQKSGETVYAGGVGMEIVLREYTSATLARPALHSHEEEDPDSDPEYPEMITVSDLSTLNTSSATNGAFVSVTVYAKANEAAIKAHGFAFVLGYDPTVLNPIFKDAGTAVTLDTQTTEHIFPDPLLYKKVTGIIPNLSASNSTIDLANHTISYVITADGGAAIPVSANGYIPICIAQFKKVSAATVIYNDSLFFTKTPTASTSWAYDGLEVIQQKYLSDDSEDKVVIPEAFSIKRQVNGQADQYTALPARAIANPKVVSVGTVAANNVANGTSWATAIAGLATSVTATTDAATNNSTTAAIAWNTTAPAGYGNGATGTYTATGTLTFPAGIDANGHTSISATVNVAAPEVIEIKTPVIIEDTTPAAMESTIIAAATAAGATGGVSVNYTGVTNGHGKIIGGQYTKNDKIVGFIKDGVTFEVKNADGQVISTGSIDVSYGSNATDAKKFEKTGTWDGDAAVSSVVANDKATVSAYAPAGSKFKLELNIGKGFGRTIVTVKDADQNIVAVDRLDTFFVANTSESFIIQNQATHTDFVAATTGVYTVEVEVNGTNISDTITGIGEASNKITISAFEIVPVV